MAKKKKRIVLFSDEEEFEEQETLLPSNQLLEIYIEKKNRGGKVATVIKNFVGSENDLKDLGKILKNKCATGGSVKEGEIIIQGNVRDKIISILSDMNYRTKRVGG